jgi:hypothetical protein
MLIREMAARTNLLGLKVAQSRILYPIKSWWYLVIAI